MTCVTSHRSPVFLYSFRTRSSSDRILKEIKNIELITNGYDVIIAGQHELDFYFLKKFSLAGFLLWSFQPNKASVGYIIFSIFIIAILIA